MPGKPFQSKLLPHAEFIRESRTLGLGYRQIAVELRSRFGLKTAPANVFSFVKVRARRRLVYALPAPEPPAASPPASRPARSTAAVTPRAVESNWLTYDSTKPLEKLSS